LDSNKDLFRIAFSLHNFIALTAPQLLEFTPYNLT
jgi:hypothetical protein